MTSPPRALPGAFRLVFLALALLVAPSARADAPAETRVDLYTMGEGDDVFSHFGHAAICVTDLRTPRGRCYNYGTADFTTPVPLTWEFIRGRAKFWVSVIDERAMLDYYRRHDRSIFRQRLPLSPESAELVARALEDSTREDVKYYRYHHFLDNCTTRIRDLLDHALDGRLSRDTKSPAHDLTFREYAERGFAGDVPLLIAAALILGRSSDRRTTDWEGMFLPDVFRREVEEALGAKPETIHASRRPPGSTETRSGQRALAGAGLVFALALGASVRVSRRLHGVVRGLTALGLGIPGLVLWSLAALTTFDELRVNEVLLVLMPFDLLLALPASAPRRIYVSLRLFGLGAVVALRAAGAFVQPLSGALILVLLPLVAIKIIERRSRART